MPVTRARAQSIATHQTSLDLSAYVLVKATFDVQRLAAIYPPQWKPSRDAPRWGYDIKNYNKKA